MNDRQAEHLNESLDRIASALEGILHHLKPKPPVKHNCPECGAIMVKRSRKADGVTFFGCSCYPDCNGLRDEDGQPKHGRSAPAPAPRPLPRPPTPPPAPPQNDWDEEDDQIPF